MELLAGQTRAALREYGPGEELAAPSRRREPRVAVDKLGRTRRLGGGPPHHLVSILLPVKNEAESLRELLPLVLGQKVNAMLEIIAVDSGSEDDTIEILRSFAATVLTIDPRDFDHGL